ncbi:hypothetical protein OU792_09710 [Algoriphagus sp. NF]|jgi:Cytochrome c biogenesis factor|uniref:Tetratricopeptide repeat-containing protein n=1 Tax=Algoriphagus marincola TaxID=264027 RepID=A0ABS7N6H7_9BACT|nr:MULTISPECIES: hypothetical protein [Algoriphagus]MBY5951939.1 hypothetical protein [Algoriphagus marincola]MDE0560260.1 hypothetical protein [Algoriphagus sp. NF]
MKIFNLIFAFVFISFSAFSQSNGAFETAIKSQIQAMEQIDSPESAQEVSNSFLRISEAESGEWLPLYYAALTKIETAFRFDVDKDAYFDEAIDLVQKAKEVSPNNSELTALHGYALMGKVSVDPVSRGQNLSPQVMQLYGTAIGQDRSNPRAVVLMAQMELGMAEFFGQGPEKACGMARMAEELFRKESQKVDENYLLPTWGANTAKALIENCQ